MTNQQALFFQQKLIVVTDWAKLHTAELYHALRCLLDYLIYNLYFGLNDRNINHNIDVTQARPVMIDHRVKNLYLREWINLLAWFIINTFYPTRHQ